MALLQRNSSLDLGYSEGLLSLFPEAIDDKDQLYEVKNNAESTLTQSLTYNGKYIVVEDNAKFPDKGLLRVGPPSGQNGNYELIYYDQKTTGTFRNLIRGFAGSRQNQWQAGSTVANSVMAEHHNAIKDAVINIEVDLGTEEFPEDESLNGILKAQENRFLSPKPIFRVYPIKGPPPLVVRFQNFSTGPLIRYLWDFGDGTTSTEKSPIHTYLKEGVYSVKLNVITSLGAQGIVTKSNYITVSDDERVPFFYVTPLTGYSTQTAAEMTAAGNPTEPTEFELVDQTDGDILQRYWVFDGDGTVEDVAVENQSIPQTDPNIHSVKFVYDVPGEYEPSLIIIYANQKLRRAFLRDTIIVS